MNRSSTSSYDDTVDVDVNATPEGGQLVVQPRRSGRQRNPPLRYGIDEYADTAVGAEVQHSAYHVSQIEEPTSIAEAMESSYSKEWKNATDQEFSALIENETWKLVELPPGRKAIDCKWLFKVKHGRNGEVERFKGTAGSKRLRAKIWS